MVRLLFSFRRVGCIELGDLEIVLRYSKYNQALRDIIASGEYGGLVNAVHVEPVGHYHFAHSYVRGNWNQEAKSSFSLMTKSCQ